MLLPVLPGTSDAVVGGRGGEEGDGDERRTA